MSDCHVSSTQEDGIRSAGCHLVTQLCEGQWERCFFLIHFFVCTRVFFLSTPRCRCVNPNKENCRAFIEIFVSSCLFTQHSVSHSATRRTRAILRIPHTHAPCGAQLTECALAEVFFKINLLLDSAPLK